MDPIGSRGGARRPRNAIRWYRRLDVRRPRVVANVALIAMVASVAVPGSVGSWLPSRMEPPPSITSRTRWRWSRLSVGRCRPPCPSIRGPDRTGTWIKARSCSSRTSRMSHPRLGRRLPSPTPGPSSWPSHAGASTATCRGMALASTASGRRVASTMTKTLVGVAHRTLPCGTKVTFKNPANGRTVTAPVVDRGPYISGRQWDLTGGLCSASIIARRVRCTGGSPAPDRSPRDRTPRAFEQGPARQRRAAQLTERAGLFVGHRPRIAAGTATPGRVADSLVSEGRRSGRARRPGDRTFPPPRSGSCGSRSPPRTARRPSCDRSPWRR